MSALPRLFLVRHGDTEWTETHQHTGRTDIPLNANGEARAAALPAMLAGVAFAEVFTSPLQRASRTCAIAGFGERAIADDDLLEWDYGAYEARKTADIRAERPGWDLFRDGCPGGESVDDVAARADHFLARARAVGGNVLAFSSGHILRTIGARWIGLPPDGGRLLFCEPATLGILGYEHDDSEPVLRLWNARPPGE